MESCRKQPCDVMRSNNADYIQDKWGAVQDPEEYQLLWRCYNYVHQEYMKPKFTLTE